MVNFEDLNITQLRKIVRGYKLHYSIPRFTKLSREELIVEMKKHLKIENDIIKSIQTQFQQEVPKKAVRKTRQPRKPRKPRQPRQPKKIEYEADSDNKDLFIYLSEDELKELSKRSSLKDDDLDDDSIVFGNLKAKQKIQLQDIKKEYKIDFYQYSKIKNNGEIYAPCIFFFREIEYKRNGRHNINIINSKDVYQGTVDMIRNMVGPDDLVGFKQMDINDDYMDYINTGKLTEDNVKNVYMITILFHLKVHISDVVKLSSSSGLVDFKTPDNDELDNIGFYLLNQMGKDNQKIFICHNSAFDELDINNELNNKLKSLGNLLRYNNLSEIWGRGTFNIANVVGRYDLDMYNITKEDNKIVLRSIACVNIKKGGEELYIEFLSGSKYTFRIFEYINNIINNKRGIDTYNSINWKKIKYLALSALASFNTLYFYQKQNMDISKEENDEIIKYIHNTFESFYKGEHYDEQLKALQDSLLDPINSKEIEDTFNTLSGDLPHLYLFFKLRDTKKIKKKIEKDINSKLIPFNIIKDLRIVVKQLTEDSDDESESISGSGRNGYAIHAVLVDKSIPFEEAFKQAQNIIKKKKFFHRESKNQHRFRNIPKQKFEPRSFKSKKVNENLTLVFGKLKPEHSHLEGAGIFDWIKSKTSGAISAVKNYFKPRLDGYNNISKKTLEQYGNMPIKQLFILRTPISGGLNKVINFVSLGKWDELKKKYAFDSLFHLSLVALLENGKNIIIEKNDVVNISPEYKMYPTSETVDIPIGNDLTINKILDTARTKIGDNTFFSYDAFKNNCQFFIRYLLEGQNLYSEQAKNFLFQDLENIYNELPSYVPKVMKGATTMGAIVDKILGRGRHQIVMNPDAFIKEHQKLITLLRQFDIPKLTVEANEQAKELKAETGVDLTGGKKKKIYK